MSKEILELLEAQNEKIEELQIAIENMHDLLQLIAGIEMLDQAGESMH